MNWGGGLFEEMIMNSSDKNFQIAIKLWKSFFNKNSKYFSLLLSIFHITSIRLIVCPTFRKYPTEMTLICGFEDKTLFFKNFVFLNSYNLFRVFIIIPKKIFRMIYGASDPENMFFISTFIACTDLWIPQRKRISKNIYCYTF